MFFRKLSSPLLLTCPYHRNLDSLILSFTSAAPVFIVIMITIITVSSYNLVIHLVIKLFKILCHCATFFGPPCTFRLKIVSKQYCADKCRFAAFAILACSFASKMHENAPIERCIQKKFPGVKPPDPTVEYTPPQTQSPSAPLLFWGN